MTTDLITRLGDIVGPRFVSGAAEERYLYALDPGTLPAATPDAVVMPANTEDVQKVVALANELKVPVVPMGAGLVLSGLTRALKGGIVVDMKRMNSIIAVSDGLKCARQVSGEKSIPFT